MARVTAEDCLEKVPNRFELVVLAAQRARALTSGAPNVVDRDNDKNSVVALREIAEGVVSAEELREHAIRHLQTRVDTDEPEEDNSSLRSGAREMAQAGMVTVREPELEDGSTLADAGG